MNFLEILERYRKANIIAIVHSNKTTFQSLQDIPKLVEQYKTLSIENEVLKTKVIALEEELNNGKQT